MSIKLIAVDMDGTFLSDAKTYNRPRFLAQYQRMREQNIRFVVASGNQYLLFPGDRPSDRLCGGKRRLGGERQ